MKEDHVSFETAKLLKEKGFALEAPKDMYKTELSMTKLSVLKHKIIRAYHNPKNWEYSKFKGYPENTYFGFESLNECIKYTIKMYIDCYGKTLKKWKYD